MQECTAIELEGRQKGAEAVRHREPAPLCAALERAYPTLGSLKEAIRHSCVDPSSVCLSCLYLFFSSLSFFFLSLSPSSSPLSVSVYVKERQEREREGGWGKGLLNLGDTYLSRHLLSGKM